MNSHGLTKEMLKRVLTQPAGKLPKEEQHLLSAMRYDRCDTPVIFVSESRPARISGSAQTRKAIENYISDNKLKIDLRACSGKGYQQYEPFVDVQLPGKARVSFGPVTPDIVPLILDGMINNNLPMEYVLWQYENPAA
jgi:hypothetical protein